MFFDLINDCVEIYMDDFVVYGETFEEALKKLEKLLIQCQEIRISHSNEKCQMLLTKGIVFWHHISPKGIRVDPAKIEINLKLSIPTTQKDAHMFLAYAWYYWRFI